jgi:hypothetical protein
MEFGHFPTEQEGLKALTDSVTYKKKTGTEAPLTEAQILDDQGNQIIYHTGRNIRNKEFKNFELIWVGAQTEEEPDIPADGN